MAKTDLSRFPRLFERVWHDISDLSLTLLGFDHPITVLCQYIKCSGLNSEIQARLIRQLHAVSKSRLGEYHSCTIYAKLDLCKFLLWTPRDFPEGETMLNQSIEYCNRVYGRYHSLTQACLFIRSRAYLARGDFDAAEPTLRDTLKRSKNNNEEVNLMILSVIRQVAIVMACRERYAESETFLNQAIHEILILYGLHHHQTIKSIGWLERVLVKQDKFTEVEQLRQQYPDAF